MSGMAFGQFFLKQLSKSLNKSMHNNPWLQVTYFTGDFVKPGVDVHLFDERVMFKVIGGDELQVRHFAAVINPLNVFHPKRAIVFDGVYFVVFHLFEPFHLPADHKVAVGDDWLHTVAGNLKSDQAAPLKAGQVEPRAFFRDEAARINSAASKGFYGSEQDVAPHKIAGSGIFFRKVEAKGRARAIEDKILVDAVFPAEFPGLGITDDPLVIIGQVGPDDVPIASVAEYFFGHVADATAIAVVFYNNAFIFEHLENPDKAVVEFETVFSDHVGSI